MNIYLLFKNYIESTRGNKEKKHRSQPDTPIEMCAQVATIYLFGLFIIIFSLSLIRIKVRGPDTNKNQKLLFIYIQEKKNTVQHSHIYERAC